MMQVLIGLGVILAIALFVALAERLTRPGPESAALPDFKWSGSGTERALTVKVGRLERKLNQARARREGYRNEAQMWHQKHLQYAAEVNRLLNESHAEQGRLRLKLRQMQNELDVTKYALALYEALGVAGARTQPEDGSNMNRGT